MGKEQSKCFWIEDYRPAHSRNRLAELEEREGKGWARVDEVRAAAPRKMRRRKAAERRGRQWRGRETARVSPSGSQSRFKKTVSRPLSFTPPPLFSSFFASFYTL